MPQGRKAKKGKGNRGRHAPARVDADAALVLHREFDEGALGEPGQLVVDGEEGERGGNDHRRAVSLRQFKRSTGGYSGKSRMKAWMPGNETRAQDT